MVLWAPIMCPRIIAILFVSTAFTAATQMTDYKGYKDPALFTRMPHYFLSTEDSLVDKPFEAFEFTVKNGAQSVEGHHLHYTYVFDESRRYQPGVFCRSSGIMRRRPGRSGARSCPTTSGGRPFASPRTARRRGLPSRPSTREDSTN